MTFIPNTDIQDTELLYRAIINQPIFWKEETNRPSSAFFKTRSDGISVDRDGNRTKEEIIIKLQLGRNDYGVGYIIAGFVRSLNLLINPDPLPDNEYHALITAEDGTGTISKAKCKRLSENFEVILKPEAFR